jgi:hypothetical protein
LEKIVNSNWGNSDTDFADILLVYSSSSQTFSHPGALEYYAIVCGIPS